MIALDIGDKIQGDADTDAIVDFVFNGVVGNKAKQVANGQLPDAKGDLYTAGSNDESIVSMVCVNTNSSPEHINLYLLESGGTARHITPVDLILGVGYQMIFDGRRLEVKDQNGGLVVSTDVFASSNLTDNAVVRGDGGAKGIQTSGVIVDDSDNMSGVNQLSLTNMKIDSGLSSDGEYSGIIFDGVAGTALAFGDVVYFSSADSKWELTDADAEATVKPRIAMVVVGGAEDATITLLEIGYVREDDWNWTTPGAPLFLDTVAGDLTETPPSGSGDCVRVAGHVVDADTIFFNASKDWFELV